MKIHHLPLFCFEVLYPEYDVHPESVTTRRHFLKKESRHRKQPWRAQMRGPLFRGQPEIGGF